MMKNNNVDPRIIHLLDELKPATPRDPRTAARGRARFLAEAVSVRKKQRHSLWTLFPLKERYTMNIILSLLVVVGLLFGGGATVVAAQNDLPNEPLYQIKLMSENASLWFTHDPVQQIDKLMQQSQTRTQEMQSLASEGVTPPIELTTRAQERIQRALQIAAQLDGETQDMAFQQIRARLQSQSQQMEQAPSDGCTECDHVLQQMHEMLQLQLHNVESEFTNPANMQNQNQDQNQDQNQNQNQVRTTQTPQPTNAVIPTTGTCTPALDGAGQQNGGNPSAGTPVQQNNQNGSGTQNGNGSGGGNNPSPGSGGQGGKP